MISKLAAQPVGIIHKERSSTFTAAKDDAVKQVEAKDRREDSFVTIEFNVSPTRTVKLWGIKVNFHVIILVITSVIKSKRGSRENHEE